MFSATYRDYTIQVADDPAYRQGSVDNMNIYDFIYGDIYGIQYEWSSRHGIAIIKDGFNRTAILLSAAIGTGVTGNSALIDKDNLVIRCGNLVFSLSLPGLELNWLKEVDMACCFAIYPYKDDYITHGELSICRLDREGTIIWEVGARDIFVVYKEGLPFQMHLDHIELMDWTGHRYKLDYDGSIADYPA